MKGYIMRTERFKLVPAVYLILKKDDTVLLSLRENTGYADGMYGLVAGHLDGNETATEGMLREVKEEIGIDIPPSGLEMKVTVHRKAPEREVIDLFFVAETWDGTIQNCEPEKCGGVSFFPIDDLPDNVLPYIKEAIEAAIDGRTFLECGWNDADELEKKTLFDVNEPEKTIEPSIHAPRNAKDLKQITEVLMSGNGLAGTGQVIKTYETALKQQFNVDHCVAVSSGTAAIHASLHALGVRAGDEVLVPSIAAVMSALPIIELGATPVFVDCEKDSLAIDTNHAKELITKKTKAILSVPMWGYPTTTSALKRFCQNKNIPLVVDAAQAIGASIDGKLEGANGDVGCFSTHEIKLISTGEGGFIIPSTKDLEDTIRTFTRLGNVEGLKKKTFGQTFGVNYKLNALAAALGTSQVEVLPARLATRRNNARIWLEALAEYNDTLRPLALETTQYKPSFYASIFLLDEKNPAGLTSRSLGEALAKEGVKTDIFKYNVQLMSDYPVFQEYHQKRTSLSSQEVFLNATSLLNKMIVLPTHEGMNETNIFKAAKKIGSLIRTPECQRSLSVGSCGQGLAVKRP